MSKTTYGFFEAILSDIKPGTLYRYRVDGRDLFPDPASRYQPHGVHGPSQVIDSTFPWSDAGRQTKSLSETIFYELHIGTFSPEGTFAGVSKRLPYLKDLGITTLEIMPVADFPGQRNWGYDGVSLFAPARCYGSPDELRRLVDSAHQLDLSIFLDVVYNHLGPDGNYLGIYSPYYFTDRHKSPWGAGVNLDGPFNRHVRESFIENALHWINEYHFDGLRLDATHAIVDESSRHFLAEFSVSVHAGATRPVILVAEDCRNRAHIVKPEDQNGWGLDAVWSDDFHHELRVLVHGDRELHYMDFSGKIDGLATTIKKGWFYTGQHSVHFNGTRGSDPDGVPQERIIVCIHNHDQIGNRAFG